MWNRRASALTVAKRSPLGPWLAARLSMRGPQRCDSCFRISRVVQVNDRCLSAWQPRKLSAEHALNSPRERERRSYNRRHGSRICVQFHWRVLRASPATGYRSFVSRWAKPGRRSGPIQNARMRLAQASRSIIDKAASSSARPYTRVRSVSAMTPLRFSIDTCAAKLSFSSLPHLQSDFRGLRLQVPVGRVSGNSRQPRISSHPWWIIRGQPQG